MLNELRRGRYGYLLALHILLLIAKGKTPTAIADTRYLQASIIVFCTDLACVSGGNNNRSLDELWIELDAQSRSRRNLQHALLTLER